MYGTGLRILIRIEAANGVGHVVIKISGLGILLPVRGGECTGRA